MQYWLIVPLKKIANMNIKQALFKARVWLVKQISLILIEFLRKRAAFHLLLSAEAHSVTIAVTAPHWCCSSYLQIRVPIKSISIKFFLHLFQCKHNKASDYQSQPKNTSDKWATVIRLAARTVMTTALVKGHPASCYHERSFNNKQRQKGVFIVHSWLEMIPWWNDLFSEASHWVRGSDV